MIDTHCHLNFPEYEEDLPEVIARAHKAGVDKIIIPGADLESSKKAVEIAQKYDGCFASVGIHPHGVDDYQRDKLQFILKLKELAQQKKVVAIGECGLDFHNFPDYPPVTSELKQQQAELFLAQLKIAGELNLPIIIHCREAYQRIFEVLDDYSSSPSTSLPTFLRVNRVNCESRRTDSGQARMTKRSFSTSSNDKVKGVFHCFGGNEEDLKRVLEMGFFVGFDGNITYKNAEHLREMVSLTPMERILLETDSPYLSPDPFRGKRNEPANIVLITKFIAEVKDIDINTINIITSKITEDLFSI